MLNRFLLLTFAAFFTTRYCIQRWQLRLLPPLLPATGVIIALLLYTHTPYQNYFSSNTLCHQLLQLAIIALAVPLYRERHHIYTYWRSILSICSIGALFAMTSGALIALWLGASPEIAASILLKSASTPFAVAVAPITGAAPAITAVLVIYAGLLGTFIGYPLFRLLGIKTQAAHGLAMGISSHALGTARCAEFSLQASAFSSLALVLCGTITSIIAPLLSHYLVQLFH